MGNNRLALEANLEIGRKIAEAGHDDEENSKYGQRFIEKLSRDLNQKFGKGFSERSLFEVIKFYQRVKLDYRLGWSHYRVLMRVKDPENRKKWEKLTAEAGYPERELRMRMTESDGRKVNRNAGLERPVGKFYHFRGYPDFLSNSARSAQNLDLGFNVFSEYLFSNSRNKFPSGTIFSGNKKGNDWVLEKAEDRDESNLFLYRCFLERVVDGDTLLLRIDLGFGIFSRQRIRLRRINSPEMETTEGRKIFRFLKKQISDVPYFVVKTHSQDKYGRYIGDVLYSEKKMEMQQLLKDGNFLNQELLAEGFAIVE